MTVIRVIDFETTGTEPPAAQVCEVGVCDLNVEERSVAEPRSWLCGVNAMPADVRAVHHITLKDCEGLCAFDADLMFADEIDAIAAHNAKFEMQFFTSPVPVICTYKAALRAWPDAPSHSNSVLRYWLEDEGLIAPDSALTQPAHRAGPDAYVTAHILAALFKAGHTGREMIAWTKQPALLSTCPLGKFRGKPWGQVEAGFLGWMLRQPDMDEELKYNAQREIARRNGEPMQ
jgi:exodeoxyribonuclease X